MLVGRLDLLFSENTQPYFNHVPENIRFLLIPLGSLLHLTASGLIAVLALLILVMFIVAWRTGENNRVSLSWLFLWLFLSELVLLVVSFYGDSLGVICHTLVAVMPMRITFWLMLLVVLDLALSLEVETTEIAVD